MNSVLISENIEYEAPKKVHHVKIEVTNFTPTRKAFKLLSVVPADALVPSVTPKPMSMEDHIITWDLKGLQTVQKTQLVFDLIGLDKDDFEECELYIRDIDPELVNGAESWDPDAYNEKNKEKSEDEKEEAQEEEEALPDENGGSPKSGKAKGGDD
jgi:hypothetical protein